MHTSLRLDPWRLALRLAILAALVVAGPVGVTAKPLVRDIRIGSSPGAYTPAPIPSCALRGAEWTCQCILLDPGSCLAGSIALSDAIRLVLND